MQSKEKLFELELQLREVTVAVWYTDVLEAVLPYQVGSNVPDPKTH